MQALQLKTIADLLASDDEQVELINGDIVKRPMARADHALVQAGLTDEIAPLKRKNGTDGWWIMTEISVRYTEHHCPTHDLAGWRKHRLPTRSSGIMQVLPDWVCEITSPGHERKDLFTQFMALQRYAVPFYWVISPEDKTLIAYKWVNEHYHVVFSQECHATDPAKAVFIPPFTEQGIDLSYIFFG